MSRARAGGSPRYPLGYRGEPLRGEESEEAPLLVRTVPAGRLAEVTADVPLATGSAAAQWWEVVDPAAGEDAPALGSATSRRSSGAEAEIRVLSVEDLPTALLLVGGMVAALRREGIDVVHAVAPGPFAELAMPRCGFSPENSPAPPSDHARLPELRATVSAGPAEPPEPSAAAGHRWLLEL